MPETFQPLQKLLQSSLGFNLSRIKFLVLFIEALITTRTVNLAALSAQLAGKARIGSHYKRLQRFMRQVTFDWEPTARLLASLSGIMEEGKWTLILDRTNWRFGRIDINILYLAVAHKNMAIPLFGCFLRTRSAATPIISTASSYWNVSSRPSARIA